MSALAGLAAAWLLMAPEVSQTGACADVSLAQSLAAALAEGDADGEGWAVRADVRPAPDGAFEAVVDIRDPSGARATRTVTSPTCAVAIEAAAFIVGSAIAEHEAAPAPVTIPAPEPEPNDTEPEPAPPAPLERTEPASAAPPQTPAPRRRDPLSGLLSVELGPALGSLPGIVGHLRLSAALEGPTWRAEVGGLATTRADARAEEEPSVGAGLGHWAVDARGCARWTQGRWSVPACAGVEAGQLYARGFGFEGARAITLPWVAALASVGVGVDLTARVRLIARGTTSVPLNRADVIVDNLGSLHVLGPLLGRLAVGVGLRI
ncbi:MAG: hypothetical protein AAGA54_36870 [Myxococcota bacterium]